MPSNLIRWSGLAALAGGALFVIGDLLGLASISEESFAKTAATGTFILQQLMFLLGMVLILFGLFGLYASQSEAAGTLGLVGFLVAFLGTALAAGASWAQTFIAPLLATEAPEFLETEPFGFVLSFTIFALGWLLFGVATLRARVYPRWAAVLLIVGAVITFFPFLPTPAVVLGVAVACLGFLLFTGRGASAEQPSRVN